MKKDLAEELNVMNSTGRKLKCPSVKKELEKQGFVIKDKIVSEKGKRNRVTFVSFPLTAE